jgi:hypothetical protein
LLQVVVNNGLDVEFVYISETLTLKIFTKDLPLVQPFTIHWF